MPRPPASRPVFAQTSLTLAPLTCVRGHAGGTHNSGSYARGPILPGAGSPASLQLFFRQRQHQQLLECQAALPVPRCPSQRHAKASQASSASIPLPEHTAGDVEHKQRSCRKEKPDAPGFYPGGCCQNKRLAVIGDCVGQHVHISLAWYHCVAVATGRVLLGRGSSRPSAMGE